MILSTSEPEARELLIAILLIAILLVLMILEVILLKFPKFWGGSGAGDDFLGVALVESIDKRSIFGLDSMPNR